MSWSEIIRRQRQPKNPKIQTTPPPPKPRNDRVCVCISCLGHLTQIRECKMIDQMFFFSLKKSNKFFEFLLCLWIIFSEWSFFYRDRSIVCNTQCVIHTVYGIQCMDSILWSIRYIRIVLYCYYLKVPLNAHIHCT